MSLSPQFLDEIRARTTLSALIGRSIKIEKAGREFKACCPFHNEKTPSFTINDEKGFAHCFGCSWHGDVIRWMTEYEGRPFLNAVADLADAVGLAWPDSVKRPDASATTNAKPIERMSVREPSEDEFVSSEGYGGEILARMGAGVSGSPIFTYLRARGIGMSVIMGRTHDLEFCPNAPIRKWRLDRSPNSVPFAPAMVARLRRPDPLLPSEQWPVTGLHITFLKDDFSGTMDRVAANGRKLPKRKMLGDVQGSCVVLGQYDPAAHLVVGEGAESTLSGLSETGNADVPCALAALSLNNLQGYPLMDDRGALPVWNLRPDMARDALYFAHHGPVTVLVDADMKAMPVRFYPNSDRPAGPKIAERSRGPFVIRPITTAERAEHCAVLATGCWKAAGALGPVRALRPRLGMDFNDQERLAKVGL